MFCFMGTGSGRRDINCFIFYFFFKFMVFPFIFSCLLLCVQYSIQRSQKLYFTIVILSSFICIFSVVSNSCVILLHCVYMSISSFKRKYKGTDVEKAPLRLCTKYAENNTKRRHFYCSLFFQVISCSHKTWVSCRLSLEFFVCACCFCPSSMSAVQKKHPRTHYD